MKYLKRFNESSYEEIKIEIADDVQWIEDSLLELTDVGYDVEVRPFQVISIGRPGVTITIKGDKLLPISIGENLLTIDSYLKEQGFVGFNPHDYDNEYSQSRYGVRVIAFLNNIRNEYENNLPDFVNMLKRFQVNAPFNSISVSYFKPEVKMNESTSEFNNIISECQDILIELSDKDIKYRVYGYKGAKILGEETYKDLIRVEVGDQYNVVKLKDMDLMFEHLFSYMESEGFVLGKDSYYENSNWDYHEACPECDSGSISPPNDLKSMEGWKCNKCKHEGHQDDFQRPEHPLSKNELFWSIKKNYHIQFMSLAFYRDK